MDLTQLFTPTLVFGLACYFLSLGIRLFFERALPTLAKSWFWSEIGLPVLPALIGIALVFGVPTFPYPVVFMVSKGAKAMFGFVSGIISAWIYRIAKATVRRLWGVDIDADIAPPAPPSPSPPSSILPPTG